MASIKIIEKHLLLVTDMGVPKKNHARSVNKKGFSVALPIRLLGEIEEIAQEESRSRNGQIEYFLDRAVQHWKVNRHYLDPLDLEGKRLPPLVGLDCDDPTSQLERVAPDAREGKPSTGLAPSAREPKPQKA